ncbi:MAG TPA: S41 family peptidase [Candidatus Tumulicola sp.]|jgi:hypothetical protein
MIDSMKRLGALIATALIFLAQTLAVPAAAPVVFASPETRLLDAMKLWGDVKFFDPEAADGRVDWDAAFAHAEPLIVAATTTASYRAAVTELLAPLRDPATHVNADVPDTGARVTVSSANAATVITVSTGVTQTEAALAADAARAGAAASKTRDVLFDLRGIAESSQGDADVLNFLFSGQSPFVALFSGTIAMPRVRSRSYLGYPNQSGGFEDYAAQDRISDSVLIEGTSHTKHHLGFLVDGSTSLPPVALALASSGNAVIYSTGGSPAILSTNAATIDLIGGVSATFRTGDLADVDSRQQLWTRRVAGVQDALAALGEAAPAAAYSRAPPETTHDDPYASLRFPPEPMRMLAIARIYNVIRYFSPYKALMRDDWETAALQGIRDERAATDARSYLLGLMRFYAHLHDSHGYVGGAIVKAEFGAGPPLEARYLHGQVVVTQVLGDDAKHGGLQVGDVVDDVDGQSVRQAMNRAERFISSSTQQAADFAALSASRPSIFSGRSATALTLRYHRPGRKAIATTTFVRGFFFAKPLRTGPVYTVLPGNVGYVDFDRLEPSAVDRMFEAMKHTRVIVFDNRGYPRGAAWEVAPRLTNATALRLALFDTPLVIEPLDAPQDDILPLPTFREFYQMLGSTTGSRYLKPTVMLVDERAISQSEHSALFFRTAAHTVFVGTPTQGANGDITSMIAPGGVVLYFTGEGVRYADGRQLQRVGILPDVRVEPTASDVATGNDVVLQKGLAEALRLSGTDARVRAGARRAEVARERANLATHRRTVASAPSGVDERALTLAWHLSDPNYSASETPKGGYQGQDELTLQRAAGNVADDAFGSYAGTLDIDSYRGKTVRVRGYLKTENVSSGAGFWLRIDGPSRQFDNMQDRWSSGTTDWKVFTIVLRVPADATAAFAGLLLVGTGIAHASGLTIDVVPDSTPTTGGSG